ncbi:MAG: ComEA family DNA-binding protein [Oscillospiraceae bacterium]
MKLNKLYTILLVAALAVAVPAILLEYVFQPTYPVSIAYAFPSVSAEAPSQEKPFAEEVLIAAEEEAVVPAKQEEDAATEAGTAPVVYFPLELNAATAEELMMIPRIGEVTASRIVEYRQQLGGYSQLEQLMDIKGIGEKTYQEISQYLYLTGDDWDKGRQS